MHKIKPGTLTVQTVKIDLKGTIEQFGASDIASSFMSSVKGTPEKHKFLYSSSSYYHAIKNIHIFSDIVMCWPKWEELPCTINKLINVGLSDEELKRLSCQEWCNLLNNNHVLVARHFQNKVEVFFMVHWAKQNIALYVLNFRKGLAHMSILSYEFSTHQLLEMNLPTLTLLRKQ